VVNCIIQMAATLPNPIDELNAILLTCRIALANDRANFCYFPGALVGLIWK